MIMAQTATSVHIDSEIKPQFDAICKQLGLSVNAAINIFARTVVRENGIPFPVTISKNSRELRSAQAQRALKELQESNEQQWTDEQIDELISNYRKSKGK